MKLIISDAAHDAMVARTWAMGCRPVGPATQLPSGNWEIELDEGLVTILQLIDKDINIAIMKACFDTSSKDTL